MTARSSCASFLQRQRRYFSTGPSLAAKSTIKRVLHDNADVPPYPHGINRWFKKSNLGLYGGLTIRTGHNVSRKSETKTRRAWRPNVFRKNLYSAALGRYIRTDVATRVLRTIRKLGGLDEYLLGEKAARIRELGVFGWRLRWRIMQTPKVQRRFALERQRLGLENLNAELARHDGQLVGIDGGQVSGQENARQVEDFDAELDRLDAAEEGENSGNVRGKDSRGKQHKGGAGVKESTVKVSTPTKPGASTSVLGYAPTMWTPVEGLAH